jgi:hypothetical protein
LRIGSAAEGQDGRFFEFPSAPESGAQLIRLDLAERGLAETLENLWNGKACGLLDAFIQVDEAPGQLPGQQSADCRLAGTHKTRKAK